MRLIALLSVFAMAGCATITTAHNYHGVNVEGGEVPIESVVIENTGWKIFDLIPIGGGDPQRPNSCSCRLFEDTTTLQNNLDMLDKEMKSVGATRIVNLCSRKIDESVFILLLTRTACRTSAVLLK
ncbi:MAG: hypothetical protein IKK82_15235 [Kiritimatiellae bacterium]|nr:hypothetical protein [Kiritimatiellia bacterium]MBR6588754.1 hypothetical protein [Kiritimatiellia bacterium]